ncbi:LamG-like jellyroll fold domain-containing protein [Dactylosporangium sp. NPDC051484]|uniref:LamG-like jellyroll fold domain-containing protein n=1 Tax=Dactylosporangium sp. NPDC051484 TaxID=3154942 RepID=UPI00344F5C47
MNAGYWLARARGTKVAQRNRIRFGRASTAVAVGVLATLALAASVPQGVVHDGPGAGFPLHLPLWLQPDLSQGLGREAFNGVPKQQSAPPAKALSREQLDSLGRAERGAGNPAGKGIGATAPYEAPKHKVEVGKTSAQSGPLSFDAKTSKLLAAKGSEDSELYQNADGSFTRKQFAGRVNVKAADGTWKRIDPSLVAQGDRLQPKVSAADVSVAKTADDPSLVTLKNIGGGSFGYSLLGAAKVPGEVKGDTAVYKAVLPGVDLELRATGDGVKENLVVASLDAGNEWVFPLSLTNLTARTGTDGAIELVGKDGKVAATIPSGLVHDSKFDLQSGGFEQATEAKYQLTTLNGKPALKVSVDKAWLADAGRVWPVVVDPTVTAYSDGTKDTTVRNDRTADQSNDTEMSIGNNGSGVKAYSFLKFDSFYSQFANVNVTAAKLSVFDSWAYTCTPESFEVNPITVGWNTGNLTYPGPAFGGAIGSLTANPGVACGNTGGNRSVGVWMTVGLSTGTFNNWARNVGNNGLAITTSQTDPMHWKKFTTANYGAAYAPFLEITYQIEMPIVTGNLPPYGYSVTSLTPELQVVAYDPDHAPNANLSYNFVVQDKDGATVWTSGYQASAALRVPAGKLKWGQQYYWIAYAYDGAYTQVSQDWYTFSTNVPQPDITSTLSQNGALGYEPSVRNYTTSATDASVATVGPALTVERAYNSLDPRTGSAFGQGWSSVFDLSVTEVMSGDATPVVNTVTVRYPAGQEIAFGRNSDGTFSPPSGRYATFTSLGAGAGYKLVDKDGTTYLFSSPLVTGSTTTPYTWGITSITDSSDRTETFHYTNKLIDTVTSASGRALHVTWSGSRVATVSTDPATTNLVANASVELPSASNPGQPDGWISNAWGSNTAAFSYLTTGHSGSRSVKVTVSSYTDGDAKWHFTPVPVTPNATYTYSDYYQATVSTRLVAQFTSTSNGISYVELNSVPATSGNAWGQTTQTITAPADAKSVAVFHLLEKVGSLTIDDVSLTADSTLPPAELVANASVELPSASNPGQPDGWISNAWGSNTAAFSYLTTGHSGSRSVKVTVSSYTDGDAKWHFTPVPVTPNATYTYSDYYQATVSTRLVAQFTSTSNGISYVELNSVPATSGNAWGQTTQTITAPADAKSVAVFHLLDKVGSLAIDDVSLTPGTSGAAGDPATALTWSYTYDANGQLQKVCPPTSATACHTYAYGTSSLYQSATMNLGPRAYWRLGETAGATAAVSEVIENQGTDNATYGNVTLGGTGPLPGSTMTTAAFNGTSSYVTIPTKDLPFGGGYQSVSLWFKAAAGDKGVLFGFGKDGVTAGSQTGAYNPALYIGTSGTLYGEFWNGAATPIASLDPVTDGNWHHVVLVGAGTRQFLYIDNRYQNYLDGAINMLSPDLIKSASIGAGWWGGAWPDEPAAGGGPAVGWFKGSMAEVSTFDRPLSTANIASIYRAGTATARPLTGVVRPSGNATATVTYESKDSTVKTVTDSNGRVWKLDAPTTQGSSKVYASAVLAGSPADYYRLGDGGSTAYAKNEVNGNPAAYNNVTLGLDGGLFDDSTVAQFDGSTSYLLLPETGPGSDVPAGGSMSASLWFKTPTGSTTGGVLLGGSAGAIGTATSYVPHLNVGTDGKLRGNFWTTTGGVGMVSPDKVNDGNWHHAAITWSSNSQKLYLDGAEIGSATSTTAAYAADHLTVGTGPWKNWAGASSATMGYFNGFISDVAYYRKQISGATVAGQYAAWQKSKNAGVPVKIVTVKDATPGQPGTQVLSSYTFDLGTGRKVAETDALGNETRYGYSENGFLRTTTDPLGNITTNEHDVRGNVVSTTTCQLQKNNVCSTVYFEYFPEGGASNPTPTPDRRNDMLIRQRDGRSTSATDSRYVTEYTYDENGNRTSTKDPLGRITKTDLTTATTQAFGAPAGTYTPKGLQRQATLPSGATQTIDYYANGDVAQVTDPAGKTVTFTYDNLGRIQTQLEVSESTPAGSGSTFTYDGQNRVLTQTGAAVTNRVTGAVHTTVTTTSYDVDGHVLSQVVSDPTGGDASRTDSSTYNAYGQVASETTGEKTTSYEYNSAGDVVREIEPDGGVTLNEYDAEHRLRFTRIQNYTGDPNAPSAPMTLTLVEKQYDGNGRLIVEIDAMGFQTVHKYTDNGLEAQVIRKNPTAGQPDFVEVDNTFDGAGNIVKSITDNGTATKTYTLDNAARVTQEVFDPAGINRITNLSLSPDDHAIASVVTDGSGTVLSRSENTYDELGRKTSQTIYNTPGLTPVARWKLDEGTGTKAADSVGNASASGSAVTWSTDHPATTNGSMAFNGQTSYVSTPNTVLDTTNGFTISAWVKTPGGSGLNASTIVAQRGINRSAFALQYIPDNSGRWSLAFANADDGLAPETRVTAAATAPLNAWTHLVGVYNADAHTMSLIVNNGTPVTTAVTQSWKPRGPMEIGRVSPGVQAPYLTGFIADVQAYSRPLSAAEIGQVYSGAAPAAGATVTRTTSKLDKAGRALSQTDPLGNVTDNTYDQAGRLAVVTGPAVQAESDGGAPVSTRPVTYIGYDTFGSRTHVKDPRGNETRTTYDSAGRVLTSIAPSYTPPGSSTAVTPTTTRVYDNTGQLTKVTDALNHDTLYYYDQLGRVSKTVAADTGVTKFEYDLNGDQLKVTDPTGAATTNTYDFLARKLTTSAVVRQDNTHYDTTFEYGTDGKLKKTTSPTGVTQELTYTAAGDVKTSKDGASNVTTTTYDAVGRPTRTTLADNSYTQVTYDISGRPTKTETFAAGGGTALTTTSQTYDRAGNILTKTDARNTTNTFTYDLAGRVTSQTQPVDTVAANNIVTSFGYDVAGNQTRFTDGRGNAFITKYNSWNLPEQQIEPSTTAHPNLSDRTFTVAYDALARPAAQTLPGGVTITNTYNDVGKLTDQTGAGAEVTTTARSFGYDLAGHLTSTTGSGGANTFTYDDRGLLRTTSGVSGSATLGYKADGQLASRLDAAGTTTYAYDSAGRLDTIANTGTSVATKLTYNTINQPKTVTYGGTGNVRTFGYNNQHRLDTDELKTSGGTSVAKITYGYDNNGNETSKATTGFGGTVTNTYTYDQANRLTSWNNGTTTTNYTFDKSGNRLTNGAKTFTYDQRNRLLTQTGGTTYTYTPRGTLASASGVLTKTDAFGQVAQQGTTTYTYDGLGRQTKTGLSYSGLDNDLAADTTATYTRDPGGAVVGVKGASAQYAYTDLHDDITGLFTATGTTLSGTTVYDPLGKVLATTGMQGSLGYQSEWTDTSTSRVNMMARWYNTDTGQFDTRDTVSNSPVPNSAAANRYAYGDDNPLTTTDPTGHWGLSSLKNAWNATTSFVKAVTPPIIYNAVSSVVSAAVDFGKAAWQVAAPFVAPIVNTVKTAVQAGKKMVAAVGHKVSQAYNKTVAKAKQAGSYAKAQAMKMPVVKKIADASKAAVKFVKDHKNAIIEGLAIVGGIAAGLACTAATGGVGAVACMVGASALINLAKDAAQGNIHSWKDALGSAGTGALQGLAGAAGGYLGGVVGGKVACWAANKLGGLAVNTFGKVMAGAISGGLSGAVNGAISDAVAQFGTTGKVDWGSVGTSALIGGVTGAFSGGRAGKNSPCGKHSFDPQTRVLMADGSTKKIEDVEVGDQVAATDPETGATQPKPVTKLWLNHDTELTDVTVRVVVSADAKPVASTSSSSTSSDSTLRLAKAGAALVAAAAAVAGETTTVLHTTQHHPFWNRTTNTWVNAADLKPGDELKTDDGANVEVTDVSNFTSAKDMRDLTVADVHTYYVLTAGQPVLVHNVNLVKPGACTSATMTPDQLGEDAQTMHDTFAKHSPPTAGDNIKDQAVTVATAQLDGQKYYTVSNNATNPGLRDFAKANGYERIWPTDMTKGIDTDAEQIIYGRLDEGDFRPKHGGSPDGIVVSSRPACGPERQNCAARGMNYPNIAQYDMPRRPLK